MSAITDINPADTNPTQYKRTHDYPEEKLQCNNYNNWL